MLRTSMVAFGVLGEMSTDAAIKAPTQKATVVKKPNIFCARTRLECIPAMTLGCNVVVVVGCCKKYT